MQSRMMLLQKAIIQMNNLADESQSVYSVGSANARFYAERTGGFRDPELLAIYKDRMDRDDAEEKAAQDAINAERCDLQRWIDVLSP